MKTASIFLLVLGLAGCITPQSKEYGQEDFADLVSSSEKNPTRFETVYDHQNITLSGPVMEADQGLFTTIVLDVEGVDVHCIGKTEVAGLRIGERVTIHGMIETDVMHYRMVLPPIPIPTSRPWMKITSCTVK